MGLKHWPFFWYLVEVQHVELRDRGVQKNCAQISLCNKLKVCLPWTSNQRKLHAHSKQCQQKILIQDKMLCKIIISISKSTEPLN